jgi:hypothetical protein
VGPRAVLDAVMKRKIPRLLPIDVFSFIFSNILIVTFSTRSVDSYATSQSNCGFSSREKYKSVAILFSRTQPQRLETGCSTSN